MDEQPIRPVTAADDRDVNERLDRVELRGKWRDWHKPGPGHSLSGEKPLGVARATPRALALSGAWVRVLDERGILFPAVPRRRQDPSGRLTELARRD